MVFGGHHHVPLRLLGQRACARGVGLGLEVLGQQLVRRHGHVLHFERRLMLPEWGPEFPPR